MLLLLTEELAVVDNLSGKISLIVYADPAHRGRVCARAGAAAGAAAQAARAGDDSVPDGERASPRAQSEFGEDAYKAAVRAHEGIHRRRRHHAGGDLAAHGDAVHRVAAVAVPRAALAQSVAVHVLLRLRRLPRRRRVAGDPRAQGRRGDHAAADRRHAAARRDARGGRGARAGARRRSQGDRRARDAARPRPQRRRAASRRSAACA